VSGSDSWAQLSTAQQNEILAFMPMFRSNISALAISLRVLNEYMNLWNNGGLSALVSVLAPSTTIPDTTGLAGAQPLLASDVTGTMTSAQGLLASYYAAADLAEFVKIAGPPNV
jgi:hypothetical protein